MTKHRALSEPAVRLLRAVVARRDPGEMKSLLKAVDGNKENLRMLLQVLESRWLISWDRPTSLGGHQVRARARGIELLKNDVYKRRGFTPALKYTTHS
jgi:hypothetical protein